MEQVTSRPGVTASGYIVPSLYCRFPTTGIPERRKMSHLYVSLF